MIVKLQTPGSDRRLLGRSLVLGLAWMIVLAAHPGRAETQTDCIDKVCLHVSRSFDRVEIEVSNGQPVPVGVRLDFKQLVNATPVPSRMPPERLVAPGARSPLVTLIRNDASVAASFPFRWQWVWGNPRALHDRAARYRMPFGGREKRILTQGANGQFSHTGESKYSFDWAMPIGTPILAARAGKVVNVADGYTKAGTAQTFLREANAVTIMHDDGTFATYAHLDPGAGARQGMYLYAGEVIGFSGNTGFSTGPHLHFSVWKPGFDGDNGTIPIRFADGSRGGFVPSEQVAYQPGCHEGGIACKPGETAQQFPARRKGYAGKSSDGTCQCKNGAIITTHLPCRMVCP
jgi:murein DD-endopeptidase MepM/ murein hydrolase activator NlpD